MGTKQDAFTELIGVVYEAATEEEVWPEVARLLAESLDGHQSILFLSNGVAGEVTPPITFGLSSSIQLQYSDRLHEDNWLAGMLNLPDGSTCRSDQFIRISEIKKTPFYNDLCLPSDVSYMGGMTLRNSESGFSGFGVQRSAKRGAFDDEDVKVLRSIGRHVARAESVRAAISAAHADQLCLEEALNRLLIGVFVVDENGLLLWSNAQGERFLHQEDGILVQQGRLQLRQSEEWQVFTGLISSAARTTLGDISPAGGEMACTRVSGKLPYRLSVSAVEQRSGRWADGARALVFVLDPESPPNLSAESLSRLYGLTPAEVRLCHQVLAQSNLNEAADALCIQVGTARSQLKSIFRKCRVHSQSELTMRLLNIGTLESGEQPSLQY